MYRKVILSKEGDKPTKLHYEIGEEIENDEYEDLLNQFTPNFEFSLVDKFIQEFSSDIVPSFKRSSAFTNEDLENIVRSFKNDYKIKKKTKRKKPISYFKPKSKRALSKNKQAKKVQKNQKKPKNSKNQKKQNDSKNQKKQNNNKNNSKKRKTQKIPKKTSKKKVDNKK